MRDGTYRAAFRPVKATALSRGLYPRAQARVLQTAFQGDTKKAYVEFSPLRLDASRGRLVLARRLLVTVVFDGVVPGETGIGSTGRSVRLRRRPSREPERLLARFATRSKGLHSVSWEDLLAATSTLSGGSPDLASSALMLDTSTMRLSRLGVPVPFHVEPRSDRFVPGSTLFFLSEGADAAYAKDAVYELAVAPGGVRMAVGASSRGRSALPTEPLTSLVSSRRFEKNADYLPGLLEARDPWIWSGFLGGSGVDYPFTLASLAPGTAKLKVDLQGGSDTTDPQDHHVRVSIGGTEVAQAHWDGMTPFSLEADVPDGVLVEGSNTLRLDSDGGQHLRRLPRPLLPRLPPRPRRRGRGPRGKDPRRRRRPGLRFLPGIRPPRPLRPKDPMARAHPGHGLSRLRRRGGPRLPRRLPRRHPPPRDPPRHALLTPGRRQPGRLDPHRPRGPSPRRRAPRPPPTGPGPLRSGRLPRATSTTTSASEKPPPTPSATSSPTPTTTGLLPAPRYVLLLGDASYDPKGFFSGTSRKDLLPSPLTRSSFLWTASDPLYASTNGDDLLPDLALGRLTAGSLAEAQAAVQKILAFENAGRTLSGNAVLVADNPDLAGDFEANANDIASLLTSRARREDLPHPVRTLHQGRRPQRLRLRSLPRLLRRSRLPGPLGQRLREHLPLPGRRPPPAPAPPAPRPHHDLLQRLLHLPLGQRHRRTPHPRPRPRRHRRLLPLRTLPRRRRSPLPPRHRPGARAGKPLRGSETSSSPLRPSTSRPAPSRSSSPSTTSSATQHSRCGKCLSVVLLRSMKPRWRGRAASRGIGELSAGRDARLRPREPPGALPQPHGGTRVPARGRQPDRSRTSPRAWPGKPTRSPTRASCDWRWRS